MGGAGCISVTANVAPRLCADFAAACAANDWPRARALHDRLFPLHKAMFSDASPAPLKYALSRIHDWFHPEVRLPIIPASDASRSEEHTSELQSLMRISYAVSCLKKNIYNHPLNIQPQIHHS